MQHYRPHPTIGNVRISNLAIQVSHEPTLTPTLELCYSEGIEISLKHHPIFPIHDHLGPRGLLWRHMPNQQQIVAYGRITDRQRKILYYVELGHDFRLSVYPMQYRTQRQLWKPIRVNPGSSWAKTPIQEISA